MLGIVVGAGVLGLIIAVMEDGEFPGWLNMAGTILVMSFTGWAVAFGLIDIVGDLLAGLIGISAASVVGAFVISALCFAGWTSSGLESRLPFTSGFRSRSDLDLHSCLGEAPRRGIVL